MITAYTVWIIALGLIFVFDVFAWRTKRPTLSGACWQALQSAPMFFRILILLVVLLLIYHLFCPAFSINHKGCI